MDESKESEVRIGLVDYLNALPINEKFKLTAASKKWGILEGPPSTINQNLAENVLDVGFASSITYGASPEKYKILPGLSISASGSAGAVFLFSHLPLNQLSEENVLLTSKSETSIGLGKIIFEEINKVNPVYSIGDAIKNQQGGFKAVLATGDDALRLLEEGQYLYQYDLGDMWKRDTGLPFVLAICVVREELCQGRSELIAEIHRELLKSRDEGCKDLETICAVSASRIPFTKVKCREYLDGIEYDLNVEKRKSLQLFFEFLVKRGDIPEFDESFNIFANLE